MRKIVIKGKCYEVFKSTKTLWGFNRTYHYHFKRIILLKSHNLENLKSYAS